MGLVVGILALILLIWGVIVLVKGAVLFGVILILVALALGAYFGVSSRSRRL